MGTWEGNWKKLVWEGECFSAVACNNSSRIFIIYSCERYHFYSPSLLSHLHSQSGVGFVFSLYEMKFDCISFQL